MARQGCWGGRTGFLAPALSSDGVSGALVPRDQTSHRRFPVVLVGKRPKRWEIESGFRDTKDIRFAMGLGTIHIRAPDRRDRLLLLNAVAVALLTLLGTAGEALGLDRILNSNTTKRRTHSLFRQGCMLNELIPTMPETRLRPLIECFAALMAEQPVFAHVLGPS